MRIAVVVPYLVRLRGSKMALSIANSLSKNHRVDIFVYNLNKDIVETVKEKIGNANLLPIKITHKHNFGVLFAFKYQVFRGIDRRLSSVILEEHKKTPIDLVLVIANEGRSIGQYMRKSGVDNPPLTALMIMELHDHGFHLYHERKLPWLRLALWPIYPIVHLFERMRFKAYDFLLSNSHWSADNFEYLYGLNVDLPMPGLDYNMFSKSKYSEPAERFIAFPTASIDSKLIELAMKLSKDGLNLISYGPREIKGIPHMGYIPENSLPDFLAGATCTLFLFDYEALGLIPLESLASGTPVVTFKKQGPYSELEGNKYATFSNNIDELENKCKEYIANGKSEEIFNECKKSVYQKSDLYSSQLLLELVKVKKTNKRQIN